MNWLTLRIDGVLAYKGWAHELTFGEFCCDVVANPQGTHGLALPYRGRRIDIEWTTFPREC